VFVFLPWSGPRTGKNKNTQKQISSGISETIVAEIQSSENYASSVSPFRPLSFYCFTAPMAGRSQLTLIAPGLAVELITSLWKYSKTTLKKQLSVIPKHVDGCSKSPA